MGRVRVSPSFMLQRNVTRLSDAAFRAYFEALLASSRDGSMGRIGASSLTELLESHRSTRLLQELVNYGLIAPEGSDWVFPRGDDIGKWWSPVRLDTRKIPPEIRDAVFKRDGRQCLKCGSTDDLTLDHIHPRSLGGDHSMENLRVLCRSCNSSKGARME